MELSSDGLSPVDHGAPSPLKAGFRTDAIASESFTKKGERIKKGQQMARLVFEGLDQQKFYIAAKKLDKPLVLNPDGSIKLSKLDKYRYVPVTLSSGTTVLINIRSAAKRLHLSQKEIVQHAKKGDLEDFIQQHIDEQSPHMTRMFDQYDQIFSKYQEQRKGLQLSPKLVAREGGTNTGLTKAQLMKVVAIASYTNINLQKEAMQIREGGHRLVVEKNIEGNLEIATLKHAKRLGAGNFGEVQQLFSIATAKMGQALKLARTGYRLVVRANQQGSLELGIERGSIDPLVNGVKKLQAIHQEKTVRGIQPPPKIVTSVSNGEVVCKEFL